LINSTTVLTSKAIENLNKIQVKRPSHFTFETASFWLHGFGREEHEFRLKKTLAELEASFSELMHRSKVEESNSL
ncbi:MAG: hypothetical protein RID25_23695, partial [Cyclobacteriaceae bacterium]